MVADRRDASPDAVARRLAAEIDGLARALSAARAPARESTRLLELASIAALHAVGIAELAAAPPVAAERRTPAPPPPELRIAA